MNVAALRALQQDLREHPEGFSMEDFDNCFMGRTMRLFGLGDDSMRSQGLLMRSLDLSSDQVDELCMNRSTPGEGQYWERWPEEYLGPHGYQRHCANPDCYVSDRVGVTPEKAIAFIDYFIEKYRPTPPEPTAADLAALEVIHA